MDPILVPGPPKTAFDKNRRMSDLIRKQIAHFKHLEEKLPPEVRASLPQHRILTEDDAARYIAPMTQLLLARAAPAQAAKSQAVQTPIAMPPRGLAKKDTRLDLAAAAAPAARNKARAGKSSARSRQSGGSGKGAK